MEQQLEIPTCIWHDEIQTRIKDIRELLMTHEQIDLTDDQSKEDQELIKKFVKGGKKGPSMWKQIENFYCKGRVQKKIWKIPFRDLTPPPPCYGKKISIFF